VFAYESVSRAVLVECRPGQLPPGPDSGADHGALATMTGWLGTPERGNRQWPISLVGSYTRGEPPCERHVPLPSQSRVDSLSVVVRIP
jgi:hypothetical protein